MANRKLGARPPRRAGRLGGGFPLYVSRPRPLGPREGRGPGGLLLRGEPHGNLLRMRSCWIAFRTRAFSHTRGMGPIRCASSRRFSSPLIFDGRCRLAPASRRGLPRWRLAPPFLGQGPPPWPMRKCPRAPGRGSGLSKLCFLEATDGIPPHLFHLFRPFRLFRLFRLFHPFRPFLLFRLIRLCRLF